MNRPTRPHLLSRLPRLSGSRTGAGAGFTLVELMVVVLIISIVCVLAIPSMSHEGYERRAYTDAASVAEIVREARTRAIARGAAQLLVMTANPAGNTASFILYESQVAVNGSGATVALDAGSALTTSSSCNSPTQWPGGGGTQTPIDEFQIGGPLEVQGNINMRINSPTDGTPLTAGNVYLCFTPGGRTWYAIVSGTTPPASFTVPLASLCAPGASGCPGAITVDVKVGAFPAGSFTADSKNLIRTVWIPSSGDTRITSQ